MHGRRLASRLLAMLADDALVVSHVTHRYGERTAVDDLSFSVRRGEAFMLLGPNGSGKTTLFRLLSTLIPLQTGHVSLLGYDLHTASAAARQALGVVFQAPSLDKKLTVAENLKHHGRLYGIAGAELRSRIDARLAAVGLTDRAGDLVERLSGGMRRRVELAKTLLSEPRLLLMDEPSTGLDPAARIDLWRTLRQLQQRDGVTLVATTHLLEEAERADRLAIMDRGRLAALDTPDNLRAEVGGDAIVIRCDEPNELSRVIAEKFGCQSSVIDGAVRLEQPDGHQWVPRLVEAFPQAILSISLGKPTLEDVFVDRTGHEFTDS